MTPTRNHHLVLVEKIHEENNPQVSQSRHDHHVLTFPVPQDTHLHVQENQVKILTRLDEVDYSFLLRYVPQERIFFVYGGMCVCVCV